MQLCDPLVIADSHRTFYFTCKRCIDLILAVGLLVFLAPLFLLLIIVIKLDSPGPAFFVQERVGSRRRREQDTVIWDVVTFSMIKFRSMTCDADETLHKEHIAAYTQGRLDPHTSGESTKLARDPRITRVGRIIRRFSIDEFPQLFNVLRGDMSLIGPRPVPVYEFVQYPRQYWQRMAALPGMTGLWQVKGRCTVSFEEQLQMDVDYARNQSPALDTKILLLTLPAILSGRGAG